MTSVCSSPHRAPSEKGSTSKKKEFASVGGWGEGGANSYLLE